MPLLVLHFPRDCSYKKHKCELRNVVGHKLGYFSVTKKNSKNAKTKSKHNKNNKTKLETKCISFVNKININHKYKSVELQFDTASDIILISEETFQMLQITNNKLYKQPEVLQENFHFQYSLIVMLNSETDTHMSLVTLRKYKI